MLTRTFCPRCVQLFNRFSITILSNRSVSTTNENSPTSIIDDTDNTVEIDRNVSRLPDDVYQQFKGTLMNNPILYIYIFIG
jgi:hypothetical protein